MNVLRLGTDVLRAICGAASPIYVQYAVTKRCNLRCRMCNSNRSRAGEHELDLEQIARLAELLASMRVALLILTGGEPFIRHDLPDIIRLFTQRGLRPRLQTNGLLATEQSIAACVRAGLREVTLSLDSLRPDVQDFINGRAGSWEKTIEALARFSRLLPRRRNMSAVNVVVSKQNLTEVPDVVRFVHAVGFYASVIPIHVTAQKDDRFIIRKNAQEFAIDNSLHEGIDAVYGKLIALKRAGYRVQNTARFLRQSAEFLASGKIQWKCESPDLYFAISPSGAFLPCVDIDTNISMLDAEFLDRWRDGAVRRQIRKLVAACPGCMYACWPEVSFLCRTPEGFIDRVRQAARLATFERKPMAADAMRQLAQDIRNGRSVTCTLP